MNYSGIGYKVVLKVKKDGAYLENGRFYGVTLIKTPLFTMRVKDMDGTSVSVSSDAGWGLVRSEENALVFSDNATAEGITVRIDLCADEEGMTFAIQVANENDALSVMEISYPTPKMQADTYSLFAPIKAGRVWEHAETRHTTEHWEYPQHACMQFFAVYTERGGIYLGVEDGTANAKRFAAVCDGSHCHVTANYYAPGGTLPRNAFTVSGVVRWSAIRGNWYDAARLYRRFVLRDASWLPEDGMGRPDTALFFRAAPFWVADYIPNTPEQENNRPMTISMGSEAQPSDYWYRAPVELQKRLGVPVAYHVYNWHKIPFNIAYPHFMPAKEEFLAHADFLRKNGIRLVPYINACAWEMHDDEWDTCNGSFSEVGCRGAAVREDGSYVVEHYPQITKAGHKSDLAIMCGGWAPWHDRMVALARKMESELPIDGIYFDEIANEPSYPCYSHDHGHLSGGGSYWQEGYNRMMARIRENKPKGNYYFTECNAEPYMKHMDGFLTWMWVDANEVPAFSAVYNGFVHLIGRCTFGKNRQNVEFFKYATAQAFVSGQHLGWCNADIVDSDAHMRFLKPLAQCRHEYADFMCRAVMLRPPQIETNLGEFVSPPNLWFEESIHSSYVLGGGYRREDTGEIRLFLVNFADKAATVSVSVSAEEYEISQKALPDGCRMEGKNMVFRGILPAESVKVLSFTGNA